MARFCPTTTTDGHRWRIGNGPVLAWGGQIAKGSNWAGRANPQGSPYHMALDSFTCGASGGGMPHRCCGPSTGVRRHRFNQPRNYQDGRRDHGDAQQDHRDHGDAQQDHRDHPNGYLRHHTFGVELHVLTRQHPCRHVRERRVADGNIKINNKVDIDPGNMTGSDKVIKSVKVVWQSTNLLSMSLGGSTIWSGPQRRRW